MASVPPPETDATTFAPGDIVAERYQLDRIVGEGGMGVVWAATHATTGRTVAIKVLKRNDPDDAARLLREARVAASLQHRNIVQVFDLWQLPGSGTLMMVMDLLHGESLAERIAKEKGLSLCATAEILFSVASALSSAHANGFVHRDLKPENIFLATESDGYTVVKVLDFGLARPTDRTLNASVTQTGSILGTPHYMAPEQVFGEKALDARVDTWALGAIFVECLNGRKLFDGENFGQIFKKITQEPLPPIASLLPEIPPGVLQLIHRMLSRTPSERPTDTEILAELQTHRASPDMRPSGTVRMPSSPSIPAASPREFPEVGALAPRGQKTVHLAAVSNTISRPRPLVARVTMGFAVVASVGVLAGGWFAVRPLFIAEPTRATTTREEPDLHPPPSPRISADPAGGPVPSASSPVATSPPAAPSAMSSADSASSSGASSAQARAEEPRSRPAKGTERAKKAKNPLDTRF